MSVHHLNHVHFHLRNILHFSVYLCDTSPFLVKSWNSSFTILQIKKPRTFLFNNFLVYYPYSLILLRFALLFFVYFFNLAEFPKILVVGSRFISVKDYYRKSTLPSFARRVIFGFDGWFAGFFGIEREMESYYHIFHSFQYVDPESYLNQSLKKNNDFMSDGFIFLRDPSFVFFLQLEKKTYFVDNEMGLIPSISLASPESKTFGFSKLLYTIPFPFSKADDGLGVYFFNDLICQLVLALYKTKMSCKNDYSLFGVDYSRSQTFLKKLQSTLINFFFYHTGNIVDSRDYCNSHNLNLTVSKFSFILGIQLLPIILHSIWIGEGQVSSNNPYLILFRNKYFYKFFSKMLRIFSRLGFSFFKRTNNIKNDDDFFTYFDSSHFFTVRRLRTFHSLNSLRHHWFFSRPMIRFKMKVSAYLHNARHIGILTFKNTSDKLFRIAKPYKIAHGKLRKVKQKKSKQ